MMGSQQVLLFAAIKGSNIFTSFFSINEHYITSKITLLSKYKLKVLLELQFSQTVTKYDLNGNNIYSCFTMNIKILIIKFLLRLQIPHTKTNTK